MSNRLDRFEEFMKGSLENHEMPYDASQWSALESKLGAPSGSSWMKWGGIAAAGAVVITAGYFLFRPAETPVVQHTSTELQKNEVRVEMPDETIVESNEPSSSNEMATENNSVSGSVESASSNEGVQTSEPSVSSEQKSTPAVSNTGTTTNTTPSTTGSSSTAVVRNDSPKSNSSSVVATENLLSKLTPEMVVSGVEICSGEEVKFTASNLPSGAVAHWDLQGVEVGEGKTHAVKLTEPGTYKVALSYSKGSEKSQVSTQTVLVKALPVPAMMWEEGLNEGRRMVTFTNDSRESSKILWVFPDGSTSGQNEVSKFFRYKGKYNVQLKATHANGCTAEVSKEVFLEEDYNLLAPNAFSPNGDNMNDAFIPAALQIMNKEFTMTIYDRSGKLVYQTRSVGMPWDGKYTSDNMPAPSGTYVWVVTMNGEEPYRGTVTLIRE